MSKATSATNERSVQKAISDLAAFVRKLDSVPLQELEHSASVIKSAAIAQAPYEHGQLEASIYTIVSRSKSRPGLRAGASARDDTSGYNYAGIQHRDTSFVHPIKGKAHFISDPFNSEVQQLKVRMREKLRVKK